MVHFEVTVHGLGPVVGRADSLQVALMAWWCLLTTVNSMKFS